MRSDTKVIKDLANKYFPIVQKHREHLHAHPELSFKEYQTHDYISGILKELKIEPTIHLGGGTGIIADIGKGDKVIALRADIDALPIREMSEKPYKSGNDGVMHACGHDAHTSCLLGAAYILKDLETELSCRVRLIFQPGEEKLPGGASFMIEDNVLDDVVAIIGQHVHPDLPVGVLGHGSGYFMASCDELYISVKGRGGHAAMPEKTVDPIAISAQIIQSLQTIVSRRGNPATPTVLSIGKINSDGGATNIIPESVSMEGTFRTYDEAWRNEAHIMIKQMVSSMAEANGAEAEVNIVKGYPSLYNNPAITQQVKEGMEQYVGSENATLIPPRMTAEDFSYYSHKVPACFYRLGTSRRDGKFTSPVHTPTFDIDPEALRIGSGFMAFMALQLTKQL